MQVVNYPSYENYQRTHKQSDIPGRTSRICYANNETVPPEKRGKEISDEDYEKFSKQYLGAKCPKMSTMKRFLVKIKNWFIKQSEKPHKITLEDVKEKGQTALDLYDAYRKYQNNQTNPTQPINLSTTV